MAFLKEGKIKSLLFSGLEKDKLINWTYQFLSDYDELGDRKQEDVFNDIKVFANSYDLSITDLESLIGLYFQEITDEDDKNILDILLELIEEGREQGFIRESKNSIYMEPLLLEEIDWPEEVREYDPEIGDPEQDDDTEPYPGGLTQDDYEDEDAEWLEWDKQSVYEKIKRSQYIMPSLNERFGNKRYSIKTVEEILQGLADKLGVKLHKGRRDRKENYATKTVMQFYNFGDVPVMIRDSKVVGMGADDVELWVLDKKNPSKGSRFHGMNGYNGVEELLSKELSKNDLPIKNIEPYNRNKLNSLIKDLKIGAANESTEALFDIVSGIFAEEEGLEEFIKNEIVVDDPIGWFVDQIA